jgi:mono/diheme cytochrome c family protein
MPFDSRSGHPERRRGGAAAVCRHVAGITSAGALIAALSVAGHGQARSIADRVYSDTQATRGQQLYQTLCANCHGATLAGVVGPPLAGDAFLAVWSARPLNDLVNKIEQTMPPGQPDSLGRPQAIDLTAFILRSGTFPSGPSDLGTAELGQITFPTRTAPASATGGTASFAPSANLAQLMRAVTFPNANILFNVQVKDPAKDKPAMPIPFDYVLWGSTVYYGWSAVDQAALAMIETAPLFLVPGRRCENGRPVPVDRADWKQYTSSLVEVGRAVYRASQSRSVDAMNKVAEQLNEACANCHKIYRDGAREGNTAGASRCQ